MVLKTLNDCNLLFKTRLFFVHFRKLLVLDRICERNSLFIDFACESSSRLLPPFCCQHAASHGPMPRAGVPAPGMSGWYVRTVEPFSSTFFCRYWT